MSMLIRFVQHTERKKKQKHTHANNYLKICLVLGYSVDVRIFENSKTASMQFFFEVILRAKKRNETKRKERIQFTLQFCPYEIHNANRNRQRPLSFAIKSSRISYVSNKNKKKTLNKWPNEQTIK